MSTYSRFRSTHFYDVVALGVDPGLAHCGFAVVVQNTKGEVRVAHTEVVVTARTPARLGVKVTADDARRLHDIQRATVRLLCELNPGIIGLETYVPLANKQGNGAFKVAMVYGLIFGLATSANRPVHAFSPQDLRRSLFGKATGTKTEVEAAVCRRIKGAAERLDKHPKSMREHVADAMGHALLALDHNRLTRRIAPAAEPEAVRASDG